MSANNDDKSNSISYNENNNNKKDDNNTTNKIDNIKKIQKKDMNNDEDNDCISCYGLLYFSYALKLENKQPKCYGIRKKEKKKIPNDQMKILDEKLLPIEPNNDVYLIGHSQASGKMNRLGVVPLMIYGFEIRNVPLTKTEIETKAKKAEDKAKRDPKAEKLLMIKKLDNLVKDFPDRFQASFKLQSNQLMKTFKETFNLQLPQRLYR